MKLAILAPCLLQHGFIRAFWKSRLQRTRLFSSPLVTKSTQSNWQQLHSNLVQVENSRSILGNFKQLYSIFENFKQLHSNLGNIQFFHLNLHTIRNVWINSNSPNHIWVIETASFKLATIGTIWETWKSFIQI